MKKHIYLFILAGTYLFNGCSDSGIDEIAIKSPAPGITISGESLGITTGSDGKSGEIFYSSRGGRSTVFVNSSDREWTYEEAGDKWLGIERIPDGLIITAPANENESALNGTLILTAVSGELTAKVEITVKQNGKGGSNLALGADEVFLTAGGQYPQVVEVLSDNDDWSFEVESYWLLVEKVEGGIKLTPDPNPHRDERHSTVDVKITYQGTELSETLDVFQDPLAFIDIEPNPVNLYSHEATVTMYVVTNQTEWELEVPQNGWLTVTGRTENSITIHVAENDTPANRYVSFDLAGGELDNIARTEVVITQIGENKNLMVFEFTLDGPNQSVTLPTYADLNCTIDWGDGTVEHVNYTGNPTHTYAVAGVYYVSVDGQVKALYFGAAPEEDRNRLTAVKQWGKTGLTDMQYGLCYARSLTSLADDTEGSFADVESFYMCFVANYELSELPANLFRYAGKAKDFRDVFNGHRKLREIPEGFFDGCVSMTTILEGFMGPPLEGDECMLEIVPANLFRNCPNLENAQSLFDEVNSLKVVPEDLFQGLPKLTTVMNAFRKTGLESIPEGLFRNCPSLINASAAFAYTPIGSVPADLFANAPTLEDFRATFMNCKNLKTVPGNLFNRNVNSYYFYNTFNGSGIETVEPGLFDNITMPVSSRQNSFQNVFYMCENLKTIPAGLFRDAAGAKNYASAFEGCKSLETIHGDMFNAAKSAAVTTSKLFTGCTSLKALPAGLFDNFERATTFANSFEGCSSLVTIAPGIFNECINVTTFASAFKDCTSLVEIPSGLFDRNDRVTTYNGAFNGCTSLKIIPSGLFSGKPAVTNMGNIFRNCTSLETIPGGLFKDMNKVTTFTYAFHSCTSLKNIPGDIFEGCEAATTMTYVFTNSGLQNVPANLFKDLAKVTSFIHVFNGCGDLVNIGLDIFSGCTAVTNFSYAFANCGKLQSIPTAIFDDCKRVTNVSYAFQNCTALSGESPKTLGSDNMTYYYLYQRENDTPYFSRPSSVTHCFTGCTGLTDYSAIPSNWKGL